MKRTPAHRARRKRQRDARKERDRRLWRQIMGRTLRQGQAADVIVVYYETVSAPVFNAAVERWRERKAGS